jgi:molybdopterin molybdotransferase
MISVAEADALLAQQSFTGGSEAVPLERAVGRVLAEAVRADRDGPPYSRVAMDGYAVLAGDERRWVVQGFQAAGQSPVRRTGSGTAIEVATGAVLPDGCDAVVPYEHTQRDGDLVTLVDVPSPSRWTHVHRQGSDYRRSEVLLAAGTRLRSPHLHSLATVGVDPVTVVRRPVWALAATGDELVEVRDMPKPWQIRRSNAAAIEGEARAWGLEPRGQSVLPDDKPRLTRGLQELIPGLDVLVLTGGVSAGALDLVPAVLADLGAAELFHRVAQRPGKPLWCGRLPAGTLVFGLPGNPVSSLFAFRRYVLPWLLAAEGRPLAERRVTVVGLPVPHPGATLFLPWSPETGVREWAGSGDFSALADSTGFLEVRSGETGNPRYHPWGTAL